MSNAVDKAQCDGREARYLQIVAKYEREEVERFPKMLAVLVEWLECGFADCLGSLFMSLELGDSFRGQFFTPFEVSSLMARMVMGDVRDQVERQGFLTFNEPACGAGGMVIACAQAIHEQKINYQQVMHVTAQDIDATAVHMTYLQLSLLHVPAVVLLGNSLSLEVREHWVTPAHVLGAWDWRLMRAGRQAEAAQCFEVPAAVDRPAPAQPIDQARQAVVAARVAQMSLFE